MNNTVEYTYSYIRSISLTMKQQHEWVKRSYNSKRIVEKEKMNSYRNILHQLKKNIENFKKNLENRVAFRK